MKDLIIWLKDLLGVTYSEARGYVILFLVLIIASLFPIIQKQYYLSQSPPVNSSNIDSIMAIIEKSYVEVKDSTTHVDLFAFDPNTCTIKQLRALGLEMDIAQRWINYRNAGGEFSSKSDVQKIYGLPEEWYMRVRDSITLPDSIPVQLASKEAMEKASDGISGDLKNSDSAGVSGVILRKPISKFDLNKADTTELMEIYGIGPVLSERIVRFRSKLGGFVSFQQLYEVYGLPPEVTDELARHSYISENYQPAQINVNDCSLQDLGTHPYLNYRMARAIIAYRNQHGTITDHEEFGHIHLVPDSVKLKLKPYLSFY